MQPLFSVNIASKTVSNSNYCASYHVLCIENRMIILVLWKLQGAFHKRSLWRVLTKWDICHIKNWVSHIIGKKIYYASDSLTFQLITVNQPDLVLFVGEALVGNEAVDQLVKFNQALADNSDRREPRLIDGILLTKFDTIDDKVSWTMPWLWQ